MDETDFRPWVDCWQCHGDGFTYDCVDGFCEDAESGCELCERRCDLCDGKGGWSETEGEAAARHTHQ